MRSELAIIFRDAYIRARAKGDFLTANRLLEHYVRSARSALSLEPRRCEMMEGSGYSHVR